MQILSKIMIVLALFAAFGTADTSAKNAKNPLKKEQKKLSKAYKNLLSKIGSLYIDSNTTLKPYCDISWQEDFCKGDIMCYSTKCLYNAETKDLYAESLTQYILNLEENNDKMINEILPRITKMIEFGLPLDNALHDFSFFNSNEILCKFWVWQRDKATLELNLTGCSDDIQVIYTFIEEKERTNAEMGYARVLNEHIRFLEMQKVRNVKLINRLRDLVAFGVPNDNKKHDFSFVDSNNSVCSYWVWRKNKDKIEVNLTGCSKGVDILYTFDNDKKFNNGTIEIYSVMDMKMD